MPGPAPMAGPGGGMAAGAMSPAGGPQMGTPMGGGAPQQQPMGPGAMMSTEAPSAIEIQNQVNPQFLEQAAALGDTDTFDAATIASMAQAPSFREMVVDYVPTLERAIDNLARIMLTLWMQEGDLKQELGDEEFTELEDNLRAVFEGLGGLVLQMNRNAILMQ